MTSHFEAQLDALERKRCPTCNGRGAVNDAEIGDTFFRVWTCRTCGGSGFNDQSRAPQPPDDMPDVDTPGKP